MNFWYYFVNALENLEPYEYRQHKIDYYAPILLEFLQICVTLLKYPDDVDDLQADQLDDLERDRHFVGESVEDCCRLLGANDVLNRVSSTQLILDLYEMYCNISNFIILYIFVKDWTTNPERSPIFQIIAPTRSNKKLAWN